MTIDLAAYLLAFSAGIVVGWLVSRDPRGRRPDCEICGQPSIATKTTFDADYDTQIVRFRSVELCCRCLNESEELDAQRRADA